MSEDGKVREETRVTGTKEYLEINFENKVGILPEKKNISAIVRLQETSYFRAGFHKRGNRHQYQDSEEEFSSFWRLSDDLPLL